MHDLHRLWNGLKLVNVEAQHLEDLRGHYFDLGEQVDVFGSTLGVDLCIGLGEGLGKHLNVSLEVKDKPYEFFGPFGLLWSVAPAVRYL